MKKSNTLPSRSRRAFCLLCAGLAVFVGQPAFTSTDDTDLVRTNTANPYVLVILDTSDSMNMTVGTFDWHPLNGDSPESKLYRSKRALYEVFEGINDVNFGFMTFNQDELRVSSKHWLYGPTEPLALGWPLSYPVVQSGSVTPTDDAFTLGPSLEKGTLGTSLDPLTDEVEAGSCDVPLNLSIDEQRAKANRFPKLGALGDQTTTLWVTPDLVGSQEVYRLEISAPGIQAGTATLGDLTLDLELAATLYKNCIPDAFSATTARATFGLLGEFLMADRGDRFVDSSKADEEAFAGFWEQSDAQSASVCSDGSPFTGKGLESNYDDPDFVPPPEAGFSGAEKKLLTDDDESCVGKECRNLKFSTQVDPIYPEIRELDRGDFIPYHWSISAKDEFLSRLNPKHGTLEPPDYGVASYFADTVDPLTGTLPLKNASQRPILATGPTPFGKAVNDYRCWYLGPNIGPAGKCRESNSKLSFETGWQQVAETRDPDFDCRRPYVILISDGEDTCGGENVAADINDFDAFGVRTWILNVGGDDAEKRFTAILANANAELININEGDQLKQELLDIIGEISSETRAFATAAVPSVQIEADDKILLTSFNPLQDSSIWAGNALAFLKPLPTKEEPAGSGRFVADTSTVCNATTTNACFLWDAGEVLKTQVNIADPVGPAVTQRRVYYPQAPSGNGVPMARAELEGSTVSGPGNAAEKDLWDGLGIPFTDGLTTSEEDARIEAKRILDFTYSIKVARLDPTDPATEIQFLLGDTFHADPVVLGGPASNLLFAQDFQGYRDFAAKHRFRRKLLVTASNDGMLHFFDTGVAEIVSDQVKFTNGTGKEIAAFVPRSILPKLRPLADGTSHLWSVDGGLAIADVYLDPTHNGSPVAADREWRTVLVAGLRRGGEIVYALDITQPDALEEKNLAGPPAQTVIVPKNPGTIPDCHDTLGSGGDLACGNELKFPSALWEFDDTVEVGGQRFRLDEDDNGEFDLAFTWSKPNIGRIQVDEGGTIVDKFVAVFGGGLDPDKPTTRGDWLYIVDIETGKVIYKQQLEDPYTLGLSGGAAPSEPAAVDINQDGLLDRIYIGTTGGYLYRVDLGPDSNGDLPELTSHGLIIDVLGVPTVVQVPRISGRKPRVVFDSINTVTGKRLPLFFRPSVLFTPLLAPHFGLALGDGDRENLWSLGQSPGRFYVFADNTDPSDPTDIITADLLETVAAGLTGADFLFNPQVGKRNGWVLNLSDNERTVTDAFALAGITVFTTYTPDQPVAPGPGGGPNKNLPRLCSRTGKSKVFAVMTTNANGVLFDTNNDRTRSIGVDTLIGKAFADLSATQNAPSSGGGSPPPPPDPLPPNRQLIFDELKKLFPSNCRFANYRIDIRAIASDTEIVEVAPVPVCIIEKNWREF